MSMANILILCLLSCSPKDDNEYVPSSTVEESATINIHILTETHDYSKPLPRMVATTDDWIVTEYEDVADAPATIILHFLNAKKQVSMLAKWFVNHYTVHLNQGHRGVPDSLGAQLPC